MHTQTARPQALIFIYLTVLFDVLAMGLVGPVLPSLLRQFTGGQIAWAAQATGQFATWWALMQLLASPLVGGLSDHYGRRPIVLLSNLGQGLDYLCMAMAPSMGWLFLGRLISGVTAASIATAGAYIADVTPGRARARAFGWLGATLSLGMVLGPAVGGALGRVSNRLPFWLAGALCLSNAVYGACVLPESLPKHARRRLHWRRINPLAPLGLIRQKPMLARLAAIMFLVSAAHQAVIHLTGLYTLERYGWDTFEVGMILTALGLCGGILQGFALGRLTARYGEVRLLRISLTCGLVGFCMYGLMPYGWMLYGAVPFLAAWNTGGAVLQALLSGWVDQNRQGELQGAQSSIWGLAGVVGPAALAQSFAWAVSRQHAGSALLGAPFFVAAMALTGALYLTRHVAAAAPSP